MEGRNLDTHFWIGQSLFGQIKLNRILWGEKNSGREFETQADKNDT